MGGEGCCTLQVADIDFCTLLIYSLRIFWKWYCEIDLWHLDLWPQTYDLGIWTFQLLFSYNFKTLFFSDIFLCSNNLLSFRNVSFTISLTCLNSHIIFSSVCYNINNIVNYLYLFDINICNSIYFVSFTNNYGYACLWNTKSTMDKCKMFSKITITWWQLQ